MKLDSISIKNFKGHTGSYQLAPFNLLHGANWSGKTRIIDAITVLLSGYHPKLGKRNADLFALASGSEMVVQGQMQGLDYWRTFKLRGDSVKAETSLSCESLNIPNVLIDAKEYFALSDRERVKYVFGLVPMQGDAEIANKIVAAIKNHQFEENTAQTQKALVSATSTFMCLFDDASAAGNTLQETLSIVLTALKADKSDTDAAIKRMTGAVGASTELATTQLPDQTPALNAARKRQEELVRKIEQIQAQMRAETQRQQKEQQITGSIMKLRAQLQPEAVAALEQRVRELEANAPKAVDVAELQAKQAKLNEIGMVQRALARGIQTLEQMLAQAQQIDKQRAALEAAIDRGVEITAGLDALEKKYAKADKAWQKWVNSSRLTDEDRRIVESVASVLLEADSRSVLAKHGQALKDMLDSMQEPKDDPKAMFQELTEKRHAKADVERLHKELAALPQHGSIADAEATLVQNRQKLTELDKQQTQLQQEHAQLQAELVAQRQYDACLAAAKDALTKTAGLRGQLEELERSLAAVATPLPVESDTKVQYEMGILKTQISNLELKQRQHVAQLGEQAQAAKALEKRQELEAQSQALKAAVAIVEAEQAALVEQAFTGILATANRITSGILRGPIVYRDGTIGIGGKTFASNKTVSGTEEVLLYAALSLSLAAQSPMKLLMIDELGRLDAVNKAKVAVRIAELIKDGTIEQCILVDVTKDGYEQVEGLNIISL